MLQRTRSASLPRDLGDGYFIGESDFHSDVYDDTKDNNEGVEVEINKTERLQSRKSIKNNLQDQLFSSKIIIKILAMIISGALSSILYEMVLKIDNSSSLFAAFILHFWIVLISLPNAIQYLIRPKIPIYYHLLIVSLSFSFLFLKSFAIQLLPMPIIIVCSNMQLVLGLFVGKFLFHKTFCLPQYLSVFIITVGCSLITLSSQYSSSSSSSSPSSSSTVFENFQGVCYILAAILSIAIMIPVGSTIVQKYNADIDEQIFYQHFLSLPLFYLQWNRIQPSIDRLFSFSTSSTSTLPLFNIPIPSIIIFLIGTTILGQVNRYLTMDISLSLNPLISQLLNAINKTIVLLVSMIYFNSPPYPTLLVWCGVAVQTIGSIGYVQASFSDSTPGNFKPNQRISRFSRVSITGKRLGMSEMDLNHLRSLAAARRNKKNEEDNEIRVAKGPNDPKEEGEGEGEGEGKGSDVNIDLNSNGIRRRVAYSTLPDMKQ